MRGLGTRGGAAVEMAMIFPLLMALTTGVVDLGHQVLVQMALAQAVQAGAAYLIMNPGDVIGGGVNTAAVMSNATGLSVAAMPAPSVINGVLTVTATTSYTPLLPWSSSPASLRAALTLRLE